MPTKTGTLASNDYYNSKVMAETLGVGDTDTLIVDNYKRVQKYIYEVGLKMKPRREFSTKKISSTELRITRII